MVVARNGKPRRANIDRRPGVTRTRLPPSWTRAIFGRPLEIKPTEADKKDAHDKDIEIETKDSKEIKEDKKDAPVFTSEKNKVKPKDSNEITISESFEKALSSAIQKKNFKKEKQEPVKEITKESKKEVTTKKSQKEKLED